MLAQSLRMLAVVALALAASLAVGFGPLSVEATGGPCRWYPKTRVETNRWTQLAKGNKEMLKGRHLGMCGVSDEFTIRQTRSQLGPISQVTWHHNKLNMECEKKSSWNSCNDRRFCRWDHAMKKCLVNVYVHDMMYHSCPGSKARRIFLCLAAYPDKDSCSKDKSCWFFSDLGLCFGKDVPSSLKLKDGSLEKWWERNINSHSKDVYFKMRGKCPVVKETFKGLIYSDSCYSVNQLGGSEAAMKKKCMDKKCDWLWFPGKPGKPGGKPYWTCMPNAALAERISYGPSDKSRVKRQAVQCFDPKLTERGEKACNEWRLV